MKVSVIGSGYVGLVTATCFADIEHEVACVDIDEKKVELINEDVPPIYEEGLEELLRKYAGKKILATTDYDYSVQNFEISFICVRKPSNDARNIKLAIVKAAAESIGKALAKKEGYHVVVVKSTVVPETTEKVVPPILEEASGKKSGPGLWGCHEPGLREGKAIEDFMNPDKIVVGAIDEKAGKTVSELYRPLDCEVTHTNPRTAEMIKYVNNSFLATKISFANEIGNICKKLDIETCEVIQAVGKAFRISSAFLNSGAGFGGSCFPKDVKALIGKAKEIGYKPTLLESVISVNETQPLMMTEWDEFKELDSEFERMKEKIVIDGRRVIKARNIDYEGLCW